MSQTVVPMIQVPDVSATVDWYTFIGFQLLRVNEEDGEVNWAKMSFGSSEVMFQSGGKPSTGHLQGRVQVLENLHDTYGMRELITRDINGFWVTFGQPIEM